MFPVLARKPGALRMLSRCALPAAVERVRRGSPLP
jgi:hypothetical protein